MTIVTDSTPGWLYILCLDRPIGNAENTRGMASHYLGFALDVPSQVATHASGHGAAITQAAVAAGIGWQVFYRPGTRALERWLKQRYKATPCLCPRCARSRGRHARAGFQPIDQLALALVDDFEFPAVPASRMDFFELAHLRNWRAERLAYTPAVDLAAIDDLV